MRKTLLSTLLLLWVVVATFSQEIAVNLPSYQPTSPEAASLGQYGRIANSSSTGQMNYSVPLYTVPLKMGSWNVALNYNYSGLLLDGDPDSVVN